MPAGNEFVASGVELSQHHGDCTFETMLRRHGLDDLCSSIWLESFTKQTS